MYDKILIKSYINKLTEDIINIEQKNKFLISTLNEVVEDLSEMHILEEMLRKELYEDSKDQ